MVHLNTNARSFTFTFIKETAQTRTIQRYIKLNRLNEQRVDGNLKQRKKKQKIIINIEQEQINIENSYIIIFQTNALYLFYLHAQNHQRLYRGTMTMLVVVEDLEGVLNAYVVCCAINIIDLFFLLQKKQKKNLSTQGF